ncbi:SDR family NAD(P)-dependent oxidoreductase [Streptomyces halstedii]|uniref:SDR family NAD(P)-dependent oxidoreductase n=1 Tax=Streptomyces halstedii TaxID=1944 RepID=UPI00334AE87B
MGDEASVRQAVARVMDAFGGLDFAVNNAGIPSHNRVLTDMTLQEWEHVLRVNVIGPWLCMKYELPALQRRGGGAIVNVASNSGLYAIPAAPAYVASKHGVVGLSKVAVGYGPDNIRVNALCPALTKTAMFDGVVARAGTQMVAQQEAVPAAQAGGVRRGRRRRGVAVLAGGHLRHHELGHLILHGDTNPGDITQRAQSSQRRRLPTADSNLSLLKQSQTRALRSSARRQASALLAQGTHSTCPLAAPPAA